MMVPRMRTIKALVKYYKMIDPETCITEHWVRQLIKRNEIPYIKQGNRFILQLDSFDEFLQTGKVLPATLIGEEEEKQSGYGELRSVR